MRRTSRTWTTSSGDLGLMSDTDEFDDRALVVQEYNRLAKKVPKALGQLLRVSLIDISIAWCENTRSR
jgi:hypothetical protein